MDSRHGLNVGKDIAIYKRLIGYLKSYWIRLVIATILMIIVSGATGILAFLVKPAMDDIFIAKDISRLYLIPIAVVAIVFVKALCDYGRYYLMADVGQSVVRDIRDQLYFHIQKLSLAFFIRTPTGVLISRITNDVNMVQASVTNAITGLVRESFTMAGLIFVVFYRDWRLALAAMVVFPVVVYPIVKFGNRLKHYSTKSMRVMGNVMTILDEALSGIRIVKAYDMEDYEGARFSEENRRFYRNWMRRLAIRAFSTPLMEFIAGISIAFMLWYGGMGVIKGTSTPGNFFSFMTALFMLYAPIRKFNELNIVVQEGIAAAKRVFDVLDTKPDIKDNPGAVELGRVKGDVEYRDVWFSYDTTRDSAERVYVLRDINLHAAPGNMVAIVGESGAGKTTLVNFLPRLFDVTSGQVLIDGKDVRDVTASSLRKNIALVTQETILFNDSVKANIAYGSYNENMDRIIEVARAANAHNFIMDLPDGYDTVIGKGGEKLSGGQRQRICIARAIMRDAPILILDEATSSLDTESEREVQAALDKLMIGRTTFVIAHRLSTVVGADRVIVLSKGDLVEEGTHSELLSRQGYYARLYHLQFENA
ncbi:MAG: lipid A export permease/ATP-binding protein MsbA [Thermodesulfobacteriota bacterium]|nr:lipid A export permease/ATP-binding protein MsbA [Thermodesulfobacteriota bacterium]